MSELEHALDIARSKITEVCTQYGVIITEASGPSFDKKILRKLNADHVHWTGEKKHEENIEDLKRTNRVEKEKEVCWEKMY